MKSFFYNVDKTKFLAPLRIQSTTEVLFDWELGFLKNVLATAPASKKEINEILLVLKDFASSCTGFKDVKANETNAEFAAQILSYAKLNKDMPASFFASITHPSYAYLANYTIEDDYTYNTYSGKTKDKSVMYGNKDIRYESTSIITISALDSSTIGDTTPSLKVDFNRLKKQQSFSLNASSLQNVLRPFLERYSLMSSSLSFPATISHAKYSRLAKDEASTISIVVGDVVSRIDAFIASINALLANEMSSSLKIDLSEYKELEWRGSLGDINNFSLSQAFYLIGNSKGENGFIGLMPTQHAYSDFFRFGIVKDIANAHLFHKMPPKELIDKFAPLSQVDVDIDFKSVKNATANPAATLIDSFISKAKLENAIASLTSRSPTTEDTLPAKRNKI